MPTDDIHADTPLSELPYDALLVVSFGGPEGPDDVMPFLENVLRGKNVPRDRMLEVSEHYQHFGGISPINQQCRDLIAELKTELESNGPNLPIYWGNRNWAPMLDDTIKQMADDGVKRAVAYFTNTYSCYSGCRQYRENIAEAQQAVGENAPRIEKLRMAYNHPAFIETMTELVQVELDKIPSERRSAASVLFTAHSIPLSMAENCAYEKQLKESCRLVSEAVAHTNWELVYQSRSGPPQQPWLEPDICDRISELHTDKKMEDLVIVPIGFVSDHMEVLFDLDTEAKDLCAELGVGFHRAPTIGTHPRTVRMVRDLIVERIGIEQGESPDRPVVGQYPANHDVCPKDCCLYTPRRPGPPNPNQDGPNQAGPNKNSPKQDAPSQDGRPKGTGRPTSQTQQQ